jgi:hypothetical protein
MTKPVLSRERFEDGLDVGTAAQITSTTPQVSSGTGTPEGAVTAPPGSIFLRTDGAAGTTLYVKETGTGNTGWTAMAPGSGGTLPFSRGGTVLNPSGALDVYIWRAPYACTVTAVKGFRSGGTGATINARRNGTSEHLAADLSLTANQTWTDGGSVQNTAYAAGDYMEIRVKSATGSPAQVVIQVDFTKP